MEAMNSRLDEISPGLVLSGRYRLDVLISYTQESMVWRSTDLALSRPVIVHLLADSDSRAGWLIDAARQTAAVKEARLCRLLDAVHSESQEPWTYVVTELPIGESLLTIIGSEQLSAVQIGFIASELTDALTHLHDRGLFHRRLRPHCVTITNNGHIKIADAMIAAALRPDPADQSMTKADDQQRDLFDCGRLLYLAATKRWPIPLTEQQRHEMGCIPAPFAQSGGESIWLAPHHLNSRIDLPLSSAIMALLRVHNHTPGPVFHSLSEAHQTFAGIAHRCAAEESLERLIIRLREGKSSDREPTRTIEEADESNSLEDWQTDPTQMIPVNLSELTDADETIIVCDSEMTAALAEGNSLSDETELVHLDESDERIDKVDTASQSSSRSGARKMNSTIFVTALIAIIVLSSLLAWRLHLGVPDDQPSIDTNGEIEAPSLAVQDDISSTYVFDPRADGGEGNENAASAHYATDGDISTAWRTLTYEGDSHFGGIKPGAGIVIDLSDIKTVSSLSLLMDNQPNGIQVMVPHEADPSAEYPPMDSVDQWRTITADESSGLEVSFQFDAPEQTRWIMVYLVDLPSVSEGQYRGGIAEIYINR